VRAAGATIFRSLRIRNYRLYFLGQIVSLTGTWMQTVALGWLVYEITGSPTQIGTVTAVQFIPVLLGSIHGGLLADRFDKRKLMICTQVAFTVQSAALTVLALTGTATLPWLYVISFVLGAITTVDNPARQAFVSEMVGRDELTNAVGLNSAIFNSARIIGPAIAGVLITLIGTTACFLINTLSFFAVIAALVAMRPDELFRSPPPARAKGQLKAGLLYAWRQPTIRLTLSMMAVIGTLAMNFLVVMPVLAKQVFHGNAGTYGFMTAVMGVGSLGGSLLAASRRNVSVRLLVVGATGFGVTMLLAAIAPTLALELVALAGTGIATMTFLATANATVQLTSVPEMRGRVMSIYMLLFLGTTPIGSPIMGWISARFGARWSLVVGGVSCFVAASFAVVSLLSHRARAEPPAVGFGNRHPLQREASG
jgi:MFS family permease